ncbi:MAG: ROK family protein [Anaerolineae bacterium]|nr:ROK family protein [Anaerolineae bacterium]
MKHIVVGLDLGGTMLRAGAVEENGHVLCIEERNILASEGPEAGIKRIIEAIQSLLSKTQTQLSGIGIGCTGPLDLERGAIQNPYTLPGWQDVPITAPLSDYFSVPVTLENDADVAALGEYWCGAGQGVQRLVAVTFGTGVGSAFIYRGHIYRGLEGCHPEGGHSIVDPNGPLCYCGAHGCWESLASGTAISEFARQAAAANPASLMSSLAGGQVEKIDTPVVVDAARRGDPTAASIIQQAARYMGIGMVNVINFFAPEMIVLSGGVMKSSDLFLPEIINQVHQNNRMVPADHVLIVKAQLGYYAGITGAAYTIYQQLSATKGN